MARFTSPSTWGRSKPISNGMTSTRDLNQSSSTASLNQYHAYPGPSGYDSHHQYNKFDRGVPAGTIGTGGSGGGGAGVGGSIHHPYASNPPAPTPIVSQDAIDQDEACYSHVYGPIIRGGPRKNHVGVCGVCRRPMKVGDGDGGKTNKLAALTGMDSTVERTGYPMGGTSSPIPGSVRLPPSASASRLLPNGQTPTGSNVVVLGGQTLTYTPAKTGSTTSSPHSGSGGAYNNATNNPFAGSKTAQLIEAHPTAGGMNYGVPPPPVSKPFDPTEDDPLDNSSHSMRSGSSADVGNSNYVVAPSIQVRSEFPTVTANANGGSAHPLTCIVVVELPSRRTGPPPSQQAPTTLSMNLDNMFISGGVGGGAPSINNSGRNDEYPTRPLQPKRGQNHHQHPPPTSSSNLTSLPPSNSNSNASSPPRNPSPIPAPAHEPAEPAAEPSLTIDAPNPAFESIALDLRNRIADWKGHPMEGLGALQKFDILSVKRDTLVREFLVYLFKEAIICVLEDKKKTASNSAIGKMVAGVASNIPSSSSSLHSDSASPKPALRLKGRIYIRHIKRVLDTSVGPELSLTIDMEDERLDSFILIFKDRTTLEGWRAVVASLVDAVRERERGGVPPPAANGVVGGEDARASGIAANQVTTTVRGRGRAGTDATGPPPGALLPPPPPAAGQQQPLGDMDEFGVAEVRQPGRSPVHSPHQQQQTTRGPRVMSTSTGETTTGTSSSIVEDDHNIGGVGGAPRNPNRGTMSSTATSAAASSSSYYAKVSGGHQMGAANGDYGSHMAQNGHQHQHQSHMQQHQQQQPPQQHNAQHQQQHQLNHYSSHMMLTSPITPVVPHASGAAPSNSLAPMPHTAMDLILVLSLPPPSSHPSTAALKFRVMKTTLDFVLGSLGIRDRLSIVTFEVGVGGRVRKTPFLRLGRALGRERLERFIDSIGKAEDNGAETGDGESANGTVTGVAIGKEENDEFAVRTGKDEKTDVVTGVNNALDTVLQRKAKNPVSGMLLVSDASDSTRRAQMDLVLARAEAANLPIHSFGYGRSHDPACLWLMSNHTSGTYTFVKDWYDLRPCLAGCIGGMMSIGLVNMKLHMKILDTHRFRIRKVSGGPHAIVSSEGQDVDVEVGEVRYGERKEMLVELELDHYGGGGAHGGRTTPGAFGRNANATDQFVQRMGLDALSISGDASPNLMDGMMDRMIDEVPVFEVDGSFFDPAATKHVSRLAHPVLLTVTLLPPPPSNRPVTPNAEKPSDPVIVRRRMELLASDMITRALVLISRKNYEQAQRIMSETRRILNTVLQAVGSNLSEPNSRNVRSRKELLTLSAIRALQAVLQDVQILTDAMDDNLEMFAHDHRNLGAQQAMILRDQKSWSGRTPIEKMFWTADSSVDLVQRSNDWVSIRD
ncbi:hypothetical protein FRB97_008116 [Tulasnella sp. 331]|nr:hypothetical protein FRB97_008116 [Tulasnella sp. 331]